MTFIGPPLPSPRDSDSLPPKTSNFEAVLETMLAAAQAAGEGFLDVTAGALRKAAGGSEARGLMVCCRLMRRMMIPGDHELSFPPGRNSASLLVRYRVPR